MNNIQSVKSIRNSRSFLLNALLIVFLFVINVSAFGNGVTNAGNTNARIADARERGSDIIKSDLLNLQTVNFYEITNTNNTEGLKAVNGVFLLNNNVVTNTEVATALKTQNQIELILKVVKNFTQTITKADGTVTKVPLVKEAIVGTLKVAVKSDVSTFKVICKRKDYPDKEYTNLKQIGNETNGEALLKQGETLELTLQEKDDKGNWNEVADALWQANNDASVKTTTKYIPVINDTLTYVVVKKDNKNPETRIYFVLEPVLTTLTTASSSVALVPNVTQLTASDQPTARSKFKTAMTAISTKNSALYTTITKSGLTVTVYIVPQSSVSSPNLAGQTSRQTSTKELYKLLSVDMFEFEAETTLVSIDHLTGGTYKNKVVKGAKLVTSLLTEERNNISDASKNKNVKLLRTDITSKIKNFNSLLETELITKVQNGMVDDAFLDKLKYEVAPADLFKYCTLGKDYDVHLNYGHPLLSGTQTDFTKVLAHEFKHIDFGIANFYEVIKWSFIRNASNGETLFDLKNNIGDNGNCGCSAEDGHEKNNPENCTVCGEENNY